ncbi:histidine kinase [Paucibacter sp. R3-3]|uniref:Histidine kinase n=1 Tax=Roseateles agri TaxID=3098619 RepID=A0ABU5DCN2_9BURK|nr:histidine kinase [Paucibacter sp. R3-3]MDY0744041.1 histidine kinase [Paucibacter sp. R3-3]
MDTSVAPTNSPREAFLRVFNLRMIAAVYYFCLLHALSRELAWYAYEPMPWSDWLYSLVQFTRQSLITGLMILLMIGCAEALLAGRRWSDGKALALQGAAVATGASGGAVLRHLAVNYGDPTAHFMWDWFYSTAGLWTLLGCMAYALLRVVRAEHAAADRLRQAAREREALEAQQMEAQVSALNAQIEPHFLFNTLANVKRLYATTPDRGRDMLVSLIAYLRAALPSMRCTDSTLGQELDLVRNYLTILQMRMGERLSFDIEAEAGLLGARLPPMVLPTLVENAIKHGLSPLPEGGRIEIHAHASGAGDEIAVEVRDNGQGFAGSGGSGVGLANTRARLGALFGSRAALELEAAQPRGVVARVRMPLVPSAA